MNALVHLALIASLLPTAALATDQNSTPDDEEPVYVWERGKDSDNPLDALSALANLPRGTPGQPRAELREQLRAAGARFLSEDDDRIVVRGKTTNGIELQVNFVYNFENDLFVSGPETITGTRVK